MRQILTEIERYYLQYSKEGFGSIIEKWKHLSATLGKRVKVTSSKGDIEGEAMEVDLDGGLLIRRDSGFVERVVSGDVVRLR